MCFSAPKMPDPKPAPLPPAKNKAEFANVDAQRQARAGSVGRAQTMLTNVTDEQVSGVAAKKRLLGE